VPEASSSNTPRGRRSLVGLIQEAGFAASPEVVRLQDFAATVQQHRYDNKLSPHPQITRTTALWAAMQVDREIRTGLEKSGISPAKLAEDLKLRTNEFPPVARIVELHDDFDDAMSQYLRQRTWNDAVGLAEVVLAILLSARNRSRGALGRRLGDVSSAISMMETLVSSTPERIESPQQEATPHAPPPIVDLDDFSGSVRELSRTFATEPSVSPGRIASELQRGEAHADYAGGRFKQVEFATTGTQAPFAEWCRRVRSLYDMEAVRASSKEVIDGRLFLLALASVDDDFAAQLDRDGIREALRAEVSVSLLTAPGFLQGGVSSEYVDPSEGISLDRDRMGVAPYVSMLATVICDRDTPMPLSVGVFGEWGSGKSYFMALLRGRIDVVRRSDPATYWTDIRQISFNAWHYADSNLWASLGDEIFRQLLQEEDDDEARQKQLRVELSNQLEQRRELEAAAKQARDKADKLRTEVALASGRRDAEARDLLEAMAESAELKRRLQTVWLLLGVRDPVERGKVLASEVAGTADEVVAIRRSLVKTWGTWAALVSVVLLSLIAVAAWSGDVREWAPRVVVSGLTGSLALAISIVAKARLGLGRLRALMDEIRVGADQATERRTQDEISGKLQALRDAEATRDLAESQLAAVAARVGEIDKELADLAPGQRLYSFLADRVAAGDYTRNLGLISTIRKDFAQLGRLMKEWQQRKERDQTAPSPIERIVLYIDDLDRCSPEQVVQVLQAVHLLVAMDLFVVVVGVDPRWLVRSLQKEYPKLLDSPLQAAGPSDGWDASPEDYLEKIFGIPFVLPPMQGHFDRVLRGIFADQEERRLPKPVELAGGGPDHDARQPAARLPAEDRAEETSDEGRSVIQPGSAIDTQGGASEPTPPTPLGSNEIEMLAMLDPLVGTPREAKRLANIYQMVRATRDLSDPSRFLGGDDQPGEYQAVVVLLGLLTAHAHLLGAVLDSPADEDAGLLGGLVHRSADETWQRFVSGLEPQRVERAAGAEQMEGPEQTAGADQAEDLWSNDVVATMTTTERDAWRNLWSGLQPVSERVSLPDLTALQFWARRIRRFSFVMSPSLEPPEPAADA
jgi:hypothetical protein